MSDEKFINAGVCIYLMDCMDFMRTVPDKYFDLAIVDPPYGIGAGNQSDKSKYVIQKNGSKKFVKDGGFAKKDWDKKSPDVGYFNELVRISKNQIVFGVNYYGHFNFGPGRIVWDKLNDHSDQNDCEIAYCSINERVDVVRFMWSGFMQGLVPAKDVKTANVQQGNKSLNEKRIHPTQKPVKLYEWILKNYAQKGMKIFDSHVGSGSIAIAAHYYDVEFVGCELDSDYFFAASERIKAQTAQGALL